ncbi:unnamed protein product [Peniophora sp. CBMAI 1063]|nr:unnamed protein product [Peniophora sp. CBMAI 1063]
MDPLSQATAWAIAKITDAAIDLATSKAKEGAKSFWEEHFIAARDQFREMQVAIEKKIDDAVEKTVQKVTENMYAIEATKIVTAFQTWTRLWAEALEDAKAGDRTALHSLQEQFKHSDIGAANRLSLLDNYLMGVSLGGGSGGFIKVLEEGFFKRLEDDEFFTIQHYYDSILVLMSRLVRIQLIGFYFQLCAMDQPNAERANKWAQELMGRFKAQKEKMLECMPPFVRKLKPNFEESPIPAEHWWRFINDDNRGQCLAVVNSRPWYYAAGLTHGVGDIHAMCKSSGTRACPEYEWRFERPLLVDREPQPKTSAERHPTADVHSQNPEAIQRQKDHDLDLTFLLNRHSHKRLTLGSELVANGARSWDPKMEQKYWNEYAWDRRNVRFKVLPVKGRPVPAFRLLGIMPTEAKTWKGMDGFATNPIPNAVWYLHDEGTSQNDF